MPSESAPRIALAPDTAPSWMVDAVIAGGGEVVPPAQAEGLIWAAPRKPEALKEVLHNASQIKWVQLPFAGIEN
ncbi:MAG: hydroxyacid dehydrogenase, partial [Actinobacteria bacterium]|nr:hydroxyacid dehydrogenase [Actinomycetota bacterium]